MECSRVVAVTIPYVLALDNEAWLLLHEVRLRGVADLDDTALVHQLLDVGLVARAARGVRVTAEGPRCAHVVGAPRRGQRRGGGGATRVRAIPPTES